jgi:hypothetical protein
MNSQKPDPITTTIYLSDRPTVCNHLIIGFRPTYYHCEWNTNHTTLFVISRLDYCDCCCDYDARESGRTRRFRQWDLRCLLACHCTLLCLAGDRNVSFARDISPPSCETSGSHRQLLSTYKIDTIAPVHDCLSLPPQESNSFDTTWDVKESFANLSSVSRIVK